MKRFDARRVRSRAMEHFGMEMGKAARRALLSKVRAGQVKSARKLTHSRTVVVTEYAGTEVTFLYCGRTKSILTFLDPSQTPPQRTRAELEAGLSH